MKKKAKCKMPAFPGWQIGWLDVVATKPSTEIKQ